MRAVLQRVKESKVYVDGKEVASIGIGLNILLGVGVGDKEEDVDKLVEKIVNLRIFEDDSGKFNLSLLDIKGSALVVSQFTLYANTKKGRRPSFELAERPERAKELYELFVEKMSKYVPTQCGIFGAMMDVYILNWGPVSIILDSKEL
ncbi:MAG: D-aminoacyl-tRNA deacylase [Pyrobaculum arsenaticum]|jgi:D-tyrosyl-tRNA(Tyr) deacylase|uniref:D-aminoacyl-tRNA deacylase n=1 Tax=Pyrobaculum arsenaticum TaxID=121277 RepID=UPI000E7F1F08|nr:D-aminoacyl-tRNA deacylase [Pyrobaculum arsenaticum]HAV40558.1 D-tyrosyl-tRNA(Tyr) deacylase [Aquificaceae bacterium]HCO39624.1 D-tyrosyl-tRNA(Tyr) deacylase [Aquificaceae bacterium]